MTHNETPRHHDASEFSDRYIRNAQRGLQVIGNSPMLARRENAIWGTLPAYMGVGVPSVHANLQSVLES